MARQALHLAAAALIFLPASALAQITHQRDQQMFCRQKSNSTYHVLA